MNHLAPLYEKQRELDARIEKEHGLEGKDLLPEKILALQVELGELANEWRGFKFWSKDQEPRTKAYSHQENIQRNYGYSSVPKYDRNPLLEEYVDGLHFILSIGLELNVEALDIEDYVQYEPYYRLNLTEQFSAVFYFASRASSMYLKLFNAYVGLGEWLGFTWEEIEQAYQSKNQVNHVRQSEGY
jgi:dimeric dUTPase (all-alpha-NTP-PPase superfamily)